MANKEILISVDEKEKRVAVVENEQLDEFFLERAYYDHLAGNIYKGKVAQVVKGMEAAFVDVGLAKNGFLFVQEFLSETLKLTVTLMWVLEISKLVNSGGLVSSSIIVMFNSIILELFIEIAVTLKA